MCSLPNPQNLCTLPYVKKYGKKLKIFGAPAYPGLFGWALNAITSVLLREGEKDQAHIPQTHRKEGDVKLEVEVREMWL